MFGWFGKKEEKSLSFADIMRVGMDNTKAIQPTDMYQKTAIAFACVEKIASQAESFKFYVKKGDTEIKNHPLHDLLFKRNLLLGGQSVFGQTIRNLLIEGEAFALRMPYGEKSKKIGRLQPIFLHDVGKNTRNHNIVESYSVNYSGQSIYIPIDLINGYSDLLRISLYSSKSYHDGVSPMEAVGIEGALINEVLQWNLSTLKKGVKPSGVFTTDSPVGLNQQQINDTLQNIKQLYSGSNNASSGILLPNGIKYNPLQMTSSDMDFYNTTMLTMKNVAIAFKVPLPLLFSDASTLDNYKMAIEEFILQTVVPLTETITGTFDSWYNTITGENIETCIELDKIDGLEMKREVKSKRMVEYVKNGILTPNEAREKLGYEAFSEINADSLFLPSSLKPIDMIDGEVMSTGVIDDNTK